MQPVYRIMTRYQVIGNKKRGTAPFFQSSEFRVQSAVFVGAPRPRMTKKESPRMIKKKTRMTKKENPRVTDL